MLKRTWAFAKVYKAEIQGLVKLWGKDPAYRRIRNLDLLLDRVSWKRGFGGVSQGDSRSHPSYEHSLFAPTEKIGYRPEGIGAAAIAEAWKGQTTI